jgi:hypothetical protein
MIENIRKYTGLMIVVFVILFISFLLLDTSSVRNIGGGGAVLRIEGKTYDGKEFSRLGTNGMELTQMLVGMQNFDLYPFMLASVMDAADENEAAEKFFITRVLLRSAAQEFGLTPGEEEISARIRKLQSFTGPDGDFDAQAFSTFIDRQIGRLGMSERDVRALVSDILIYEKLDEIVGGGLAPTREAITRNHALQNQRVSGAVARFELAPFEQAIQPTDDEIRTFWENIQDSFMTEPRRSFTYILAKANLPPEISAEDGELPPLDFKDLALSEAERSAKEATQRAEIAAKRAEERRTKQREIDTKVDDLLFELEQDPKLTLEAVAEKKGLEVKTSGLFPKSAPPADLAMALRKAGRNGNVVDQLFRMVTTTDPFSKISPAFPVGEGDWIVARLDEIEASRVKTFEEAKDDARALYIKENAEKAMKEAAAAAIVKIQESLAAGKSFAEAVEAAGLEAPHAFENITSAHQPDAAKEPQTLFEKARVTAPGTVAELITEGDRAFILFVGKRELVKDPNMAQAINDQLDQTKRGNQSTALVAWLRARTAAADVQQLWKEK